MSENIEFMQFLLEIANENKKLSESQKNDVKNFIEEHQKLIKENDSKFQDLLNKQDLKQKLEQEEQDNKIVELLDQPMQIKRI